MRTAIVISMALIALSSNPLFTHHERSTASAAPISVPATTTPLHMPTSARIQNGSLPTHDGGVSGGPPAANLPVPVSAAH